MSFMSFLLGMSLGIGFCVWRQVELDQQLRKIFNLLANDLNHAPSLPLLSLVRREVLTVKEKISQLEDDLKIYQNLIEIAPFGYLLIDQENQLIWLNKEAKILLNIASDRWQDGQTRLFLEVVRSYELDQLIENTRKSENYQTLEWEYYPHKYPNQSSDLKNYKSFLYLKASSYLLSNGNIAIFLENKQSLSDLQKDRERSFSDLTHELKTPLTAIRLVAETLEKRLSKPELTWVQQMLKETNRLIDLVQNWLEITQLKEDPHQYLEYETIELRELIFSVWENLQPLAKTKELNFYYTGPESVFLQGDRPRLTQVFVNIIDNAIKHSPVSGLIKLEMTENPRQPTVEINIIDTGNGFVEEDIPIVFKRLYKADASRTRQSSQLTNQGNGLGLAIVEQIITAHKGQIQAKNHPETGGAWLQIILPKK
jgi:two-component system, OmpR family, phosphate regulon sensor histidine kinase PhoR